VTSTLTLILALIAIPPTTKPNIVDISVEHCKNVTSERVAEAKLIAHKLYAIERLFNVPKNLEGMLLAAACAESGFNPVAKGDRKFSKNKKTPKAIGILQLWPWWESGRWGYKVDRKDPEASAKAWMKHIVKQIPSVRRKCKPRSKSLLWIQAWVQAIRSPKPSGRCREKPKHLRYLRKFQKIQKRGKPKS
jgi:hypothetical protein